MPATEQTWRDSKLMHVVFGVSSLAMLGATIWMIVADYDREWKTYQRQFLYKVEPWVTQARLDLEKSDEYEAKRSKLVAKLNEAKAIPPSSELIAAFKSKVLAAPPVSQPHVWSDETKPDFTNLDELAKRLQETASLPVASSAPARSGDQPGDVETLTTTNGEEKTAPSQEPARNDAAEELTPAQKQERLIEERQKLLDHLQSEFIAPARFIEDDVQRRLKFRRADLAVLTSNYSIAVDEAASADQLAKLQAEIDGVQADVANFDEQYQDANTFRKDLEEIVAKMREDEAAAQKALEEHDAEVSRLQKVAEEQRRTSKRVLEIFPLDAFNSPLKIDNIWLPKLTINNNFRDVARFDRCTTCHRGIDVTAPGSATAPGYKPQEEVIVSLPTPAAPGDAASTEQLYGFTLAEEGLLHADDVTIEVVRPRTPAARAELQAGDVITFINEVKVTGRKVADTYLTQSVKWGQPLELKVRRGVPQPFSSHPRLDLFVGSLSPHKMGQIGCTICHEGQGSATAFKWASHTPNTVAEADRWAKEHGWFDNHHWIFPMLPSRFAEASCLKCHHEVAELEPSERFPDPPAPKLVEGYNLVRQYGCFGCHEINGFDGPRRIGPDVRAEPNYTFAAQQLLIDPGLTPRERSLAQQVIADPTNDSARRHLVQALEADARRLAVPPSGGNQPMGTDGTSPPEGGTTNGSHLSPASHKLASVLADQENAGQFRKVGPSLRHLASKVDFNFLYNWVRKPSDFRPTTRMPQFFELHDHLVPVPVTKDGKPVIVDGKPVKENVGLHESQKFEPIEIRAASEFLLAASQPLKYIEKPAEVTAEPSVERGKELFNLRGCLACHSHRDFPASKATHGPDLSNIGDKFAHAAGRRWLYTWLREPNHYNPRTLMPNTFLLPIEHKDKEGKVQEVTDPAADIAAYLLGSRGAALPAVPEFTAADAKALYDLALQHLAAGHPKKRAERYLQEGIPETEAANIKGDEVELVGKLTDDNRIEKQLLYVGRRTLSKYGCFGCHDIPGFESAKPIGTALADWGRKDPAKLAFEQISQFMLETHGTGKFESHEHADGHEDHSAGEAAHELKYRDMEPSVGYLLEKLMHHQREGFLWQKLRQPRSYDYMKTQNKPYNDRLRMPKFPFDQQQIEAIMTFVLGLVAEPPAGQFVYNPPPREKAILEGNKLLDKYNCAGCHTLQMDRYEFNFDPKYVEYQAEKQFPPNEYDIFRPDFTEKQIAQSKQLDRRGLGHAEITAEVFVGEDGSVQVLENEDDPSLNAHLFTLWKNALVNGQPWLASEQLPVPPAWITRHRPAVGGDLARMIHGVVLARERESNPNAKFADAWGWVPPPLVGEGEKVQTDWLHDFLLDPFPIRPPVVLRMPKFNMSSAEASKLANYFAAIDRAEYPYEFDSRTRESHLAAEEARFPGRLDDALKIATNGNYCIKCHLIGDFTPAGSDKALAPRLDRVHNRIRPEYLQAWLSNPKRLLPYTGMPVNFPLDKPLDPNVFTGDKGPLITDGKSPDQLDAVIDLLLNYDDYMKQQKSIKPLVQLPPAAPAAGGQE